MFTINNKIHKNVLVQCDHGLMIVNRFDTFTDGWGPGPGGVVLDHGNNNTVEASHTVDILQQLNKETPIIFDVGANIGTYTNWLARRYPLGKIFSFEPQRIIFQMLCGNQAINNIENVFTYNYLVGSKNQFVDLRPIDYNRHNNFGGIGFTPTRLEKYGQTYFKDGDVEIVEMITLDTFIERYKIPKVDFIKVDAEGMDLEVLDGAANLIKEFKPALYVEYAGLDDDYARAEHMLRLRLISLGYHNITKIGLDLVAK